MGDANANMVKFGEHGNTGMVTKPDDRENKNENTTSEIVYNDLEKAKKHQANMSCPTCKIPRTFKVNVNRRLIPLKIALFCWFSGCSALTPFISVYVKQLGLSLDQISVIYVISPFIQFLGPTVSGIVADKLGRSKPVLLGNLFLVLVMSNSMLFIPPMQSHLCNDTSIDCHTETTGNISNTELCNIQENDSLMISCSFHCPREMSFHRKHICFQNYVSECDLLSRNGIFHNLSLPAYLLDNETAKNCTTGYDVYNSTWCLSHILNNCTSTCRRNMNINTEKIPCENQEGKVKLFIVSFILLIAVNTFITSVYRIFDVTSMSMVKTYNSDFGRQRVWSVTGAMISPPVAGYIISVISPLNGPQKYEVAFYLFDAMVLLTIAIIWKLDVKIEPPAKGMLKKTARILKNIDILAFMCTVFVLGTNWCFVKAFSSWYLEDLGAPSILIGLVPALSCLLGLPFLFTSNWFVQKAGSTNLLVLALIGYVALCTGYSFLTDPWWALIYQVFEVTTYHLLWVSVVTHSYNVAPHGLTATVIATAGGLHYTLGKGSGSLIGGVIMSKYGGRMAFRVMAAISATAAVIYSLYLYLSKKFRIKTTDLQDTEISNLEVLPVDFKPKIAAM